MKHMVRGALLAAIALLMVSGAAVAGGNLTTVMIDSAKVLGPDTSVVAAHQIWSTPFRVPYGLKGFTASACVVDTNAGSGGASDSIEVQLYKCLNPAFAQVASQVGNSPAHVDSTHVKVLTLTPLAVDDGTVMSLCKFHYVVEDSISAGGYEVGGWMRWRIIEGTADHVTNKYDTMGAPYTLHLRLEHEGDD